MMPFRAIVSRDLLLSWRLGGSFLSGALFLLVLVLLMPLSFGPNLTQLAALAPSLIWIGALLASLLTLDRLFQADEDDGSLDLFFLSSVPLEIFIMAKLLAHWLASTAPLILLVPLYGLVLGMEMNALDDLMLSLLIGTPALTALGAFGAALTLNLRRGGLLLPLLVLPLTLPVLLFGVFVAQPLELSGLNEKPYLILTGLSLLALALSPLATAAALKASRV